MRVLASHSKDHIVHVELLQPKNCQKTILHLWVSLIYHYLLNSLLQALVLILLSQSQSLTLSYMYEIP